MSRLQFLPLALLLVAPRIEARAQVLAPADRTALVDSLASALARRYVAADVGARMAADLRARAARDAYAGLSAHDLSSQLTSDLRAIAHDKHLRVVYRPGEPAEEDERDEAGREAWVREANYGIGKVEILQGNVGLLELNGFLPPDLVRAALLDAMRKLAGVDALIVDLRRNGGGNPETVALVSTLLFPRGKRIHLNDLYWREGDRTDHFYTDAELDIPRISGPVYVLTSSYTFSAAEEFTYNLKQLKRATQVGEMTGGGANPGGGVRLPAGFGVFLPTGRAVNPYSHDNWEGKGCVPEVPTDAASALETAHRLALEKLGKAGT